MPHFHAQFLHDTNSLHKDGGSTNELWRFHKNWHTSTLSVKAYRTKLLFKSLISWSTSVKAVTVYLKMKRTNCEVSSGNFAMCLLLKCWKSQSFLEILIATLKRGRGFEMEPWKGSCCSRRDASAELGDQDRRHWTCEQVVCQNNVYFWERPFPIS